MFIALYVRFDTSPVMGDMRRAAPPELGRLKNASDYKHTAPTERKPSAL